MPLPSQGPEESRKEFLQRCMSDSVMKKEYPDSDQRIAVCISRIPSSDSSILDQVDDILFTFNSQEEEEES